jgi:hypothetical protein
MGGLPHEDDWNILRLSTCHHLRRSLPHHLLIKLLARGELTYGGGSASGRSYARLTRLWLSDKHFFGQYFINNA